MPELAIQARIGERRKRRVPDEPFGELVLDEAHEVAILRLRVVRILHLEGIERIAVARRVDLRFVNVVADALEKAADAREELLLVGHVHHDLQTFARGGEPRLDDGLLRVHAVVQEPRVPGDLVRVVPQEIRRIELRPELLLRVRRQRVEPQLRERLLLSRLHARLEIDRVAGQEAACEVEQIFEELGLPRVPDLRARAANVRDGQQVQRVQPPLVADPLGERLDDVGVADVLLLRRCGHDEMVRHEPRDELGVFAGEAVRACEAQRIDRAELGMVAAAPLRRYRGTGRRGKAPRDARNRSSAGCTAEIRARARAPRSGAGCARPSGCARRPCRRGRDRAASGRRCGRRRAGSGRARRTGSCAAARGRRATGCAGCA